MSSLNLGSPSSIAGIALRSKLSPRKTESAPPLGQRDAFSHEAYEARSCWSCTSVSACVCCCGWWCGCTGASEELSCAKELARSAVGVNGEEGPEDPEATEEGGEPSWLCSWLCTMESG